MKKISVIHSSNLPFKPITPLIVLWLLLDRLHAPEWLWGMYYLFMAFVLYCYCIYLSTRKRIKIFKDID